eukprot:76104-Prymnesium_polylepis.1
MARISKAPHSGTLRTPAPAPGKIHVDLKGPMVQSIGGSIHAMFGTDEYTRQVFFECLKTKDR